jgi:hypothetical protein
MKLFFASVFSVLILFGCGEKKEETPLLTDENKYEFDTTSLPTTVIEDKDRTFNFTYKFNKGNKYRYRLTTISEDAQTIQMDTIINQNVKQTVIYLFECEAVDIDQDGITELTILINSVKLDAASDDQQFSYESGAKSDSAEKSRFPEFESLTNNPFSLRLTKQGEILEIFRVDKIVTKYLQTRGLTDSVTAEEKSIVKNDLVEGVLKPLTIQIFREMPSKAAAKDTTWSVTQPASRFMVFSVQNTNIYRVEDLEMLEGDTLVKLNAGVESKITGETRAVDRGITYDFTKPVTTAEGTIYFNLTDGLIQKSKTQTTIDISYTMEADTPQGKQRGSKKETIRNTNLVEKL